MDFDLGGTNLWILAVLISGRSIAFRRKNEWLKQLRADARLFQLERQRFEDWEKNQKNVR
jgi:hypothetical protein